MSSFHFSKLFLFLFLLFRIFLFLLLLLKIFFFSTVFSNQLWSDAGSVTKHGVQKSYKKKKKEVVLKNIEVHESWNHLMQNFSHVHPCNAMTTKNNTHFISNLSIICTMNFVQ